MLQGWQITLCPWQLVKTSSGRPLTSSRVPGSNTGPVESFTSFQERKRKKKPQRVEPRGQQLPDRKAMAEPCSVLVAPLLPGDAPGWQKSHPPLQNRNLCPGIALPSPTSPRLVWGVQGEQGFSPPPFLHHGHPTTLLPCPFPWEIPWHSPSSQATPRLLPRHCHAHGKRCWRETSRLQPCHPTFPQALSSPFPFGPEWNSPPPLF